MVREYVVTEVTTLIGQNNYYHAAAHAQSGVKLSVCSVGRQKNIEIRPLRTVYGFNNIEIREKRIYCPFWAPVSSTWLFLGMLAVPKINQVRSACHNCKLRANTDGMHGWSFRACT